MAERGSTYEFKYKTKEEVTPMRKVQISFHSIRARSLILSKGHKLKALTLCTHIKQLEMNCGSIQQFHSLSFWAHTEIPEATKIIAKDRLSRI